MAPLPARTPSGYGLGWRQPALPVRGLLLGAAAAPWAREEVNVDLTPHFRPTRNQQWLGACTGFALAGLVDYAVDRAIRDDVWPDAPFTASPLGIYYQERERMGLADTDSGASLIDGLEVLRAGLLSETDVPYVPERFRDRPSPAALTRSKLRRAVNADVLAHDEGTIVHTLASGYPVAFGAALFESFESEAVRRTGEVPFPRDTESVVGGHAMIACGVYGPPGNRRVRVRNSWGPEWGAGGYCTLPMAYLLNPGLTGELLTLRVVSPAPRRA